jgi:hypothetical protein
MRVPVSLFPLISAGLTSSANIFLALCLEPSSYILLPMHISKIVSGGQTGADRGGWEAAIYCSLPYGGWIPQGRKAEDGIIPAKYSGLQETGSSDYPSRTEANVVDSDATLVFTYGTPTGGSKQTVELALKHKRPFLAVNLDEPREKTIKQIGRSRGEDRGDRKSMSKLLHRKPVVPFNRHPVPTSAPPSR